MDRRRHRRVPWTDGNEDLVLEVEEPGQQWRPIPYSMVDLSAGGAGILVPEPIEPGSRVRLTFRLPSRLGRPAELDEAGDVERVPWSGLAELVHGRQIPEDARTTAELPHHRGARFTDVEPDAELRLLQALYGPLPPGWTVEAYRVKAGSGQEHQARYAVFKDGRRVALGFATFDRARTRAVSMHMDETVEQYSRPGGSQAGDSELEKAEEQ